MRPVLRWRRAGSLRSGTRGSSSRGCLVGLALEFRGVLTYGDVYCSINFRFRSDIIPGGLYHTSFKYAKPDTTHSLDHTVTLTEHGLRAPTEAERQRRGCLCANNSELSLQGPMSTTERHKVQLTKNSMHLYTLHTPATPNAQAASGRSAQARARPSHVHRILIYSVARPHASRTAHRIYYSITATSHRGHSVRHRRTRHRCNSTDSRTQSLSDSSAARRHISCFLYSVCRRRLVKCLDVHRDGGRSGRRRAHVGNEHVRALRVVGGKPPVGVERADDGGVTRVPVWNAYGMQSARNSVRAAPYMLELCWNARSPRPASVL